MNRQNCYSKHMTLDDRISIEKGLDQHLSLRSICLTVRKRSHHHLKNPKAQVFPGNPDVLMNLLTNVLWQKIAKRKIFVVPMPLFAKGCADPAIIATLSLRGLYSSILPYCSLLDKSPFLSAMVASKIPATSIKPTTAHPSAHRQYKTILVESRACINISPADLVALDELVTPLILQGQSHQILPPQSSEIALSENSL